LFHFYILHGAGDMKKRTSFHLGRSQRRRKLAKLQTRCVAPVDFRLVDNPNEVYDFSNCCDKQLTAYSGRDVSSFYQVEGRKPLNLNTQERTRFFWDCSIPKGLKADHEAVLLFVSQADQWRRFIGARLSKNCLRPPILASELLAALYKKIAKKFT